MKHVSVLVFAAAVAIPLWPAGSRAQSAVQAEFTPAVGQKFEVRLEPAKITVEGEGALASKGYVKIGTVNAWRTGKDTSPDVIELLRANTLRKASDFGGDVVRLDKEAVKEVREVPKRVCKETANTTSLLQQNVPDPQTCSTDQNHALHCIGGGAHSELRQVTTTRCVKWEETKDVTKERVVVTEGTVWLDVNAKDYRGAPAVLVAALQGHNDVAEWLLAHGADVNAKNDNGYTPLHVASYIGRKDLAQWLLANKADVDAKDNNGATPLHVASYAGRKEVIELLLINKADVNAREKDGVTPLHLAVARGNNEVAELLRQHGGHE